MTGFEQLALRYVSTHRASIRSDLIYAMARRYLTKHDGGIRKLAGSILANSDNPAVIPALIEARATVELVCVGRAATAHLVQHAEELNNNSAYAAAMLGLIGDPDARAPLKVIYRNLPPSGPFDWADAIRKSRAAFGDDLKAARRLSEMHRRHVASTELRSAIKNALRILDDL